MGLRRYVHKATHAVERYTKKATGSSGLADAAGKVFKYGVALNPATVVNPAGAAIPVVEGAEHLYGKLKGFKDKLLEQPEEEGVEIDMSGVEEALAMMAEYQNMALQAAMKEEQPAEPLKNAQQAYDGAQADTNRLQLLRRGLMSTFTRYGGGLGGNRQTLGV